MYLKEIQASGFKSFADKVTIHLDDNITCIVGPNGSGKSNVVDAVRWVLGEQSVKSLRGDGSMSDVIFSGSKSRNPLNVASVCLIFDNTDHYLNVPYTEVSVKRRVYRSGENEYFLNGEKCRLKDITDLFMDSGIGKESFNIISQGEVDRILSNSAYDRRVIFEEAAGVLKYKKRKEEAIRKLDRTHQNLDRVNDIIGELENQIEPLREQSKKAKEYLETKENLEKVEVALLAYEIENLNDEYQKAKTRQEELQQEILSLTTSSSGSDAFIDSRKMELLRLEKEVSSFQNQLLELTKKEERLNGDKKILQERRKYQATDGRLHENIAHLTERGLQLDNEIELLEKDIHYLSQSVEEIQAKDRAIADELERAKANQEKLELEYNTKRRDKIELENKISVLENFIESGGGLPNSVRSVLNNPRLRGVHNCIGQLVDCDEKFQKALDVALGGSKQFIVVDNEQVAKDAIFYLKENKLGRCTFFPLNVIRPKSVDAETLQLLRGEMGYIDVFSSLVHCDPIYRNIIANQLGNVLVVLDIDSANRISRRIQNRYKIVTLDGEIIHVGGSITGGNLASGNRSMISDKYDLIRFKRSLEEITRVLSECDASSQELSTRRKEIEERKEKTQSALFQERESLRNKLTILEAKRQEKQDTNQELVSLNHVVDSSLSQEEMRLMEAFYETQREKEILAQTLNQKTKDVDKIKAEIEEWEAKRKLTNSSLTKKQSEMSELEVQINRMDVKLDYDLNTLSETYELTFEKAKDKYPLTLEVEEAKNKVTIYKNTIKRIGMVNLEAIEEFERVNERYQFLNSQKEELLSAKDTLLEIIEEMDQVMKEEFKATFQLIEKEFEVVFRQLFNGGRASLKLTDPDNLLETGVEIVASPPGKKLTTISLLSGGEKTLTAISLLFAILNVRTVPFCLFDEVEAALDEANVDRFGKYLDHYKEKTQFLLITHKKKTMEYANTLYGITMQESGVSKLVSVKLDEHEKNP